MTISVNPEPPVDKEVESTCATRYFPWWEMSFCCISLAALAAFFIVMSFCPRECHQATISCPLNTTAQRVVNATGKGKPTTRPVFCSSSSHCIPGYACVSSQQFPSVHLCCKPATKYRKPVSGISADSKFKTDQFYRGVPPKRQQLDSYTTQPGCPDNLIPYYPYGLLLPLQCTATGKAGCPTIYQCVLSTIPEIAVCCLDPKPIPKILPPAPKIKPISAATNPVVKDKDLSNRVLREDILRRDDELMKLVARQNWSGVAQMYTDDCAYIAPGRTVIRGKRGVQSRFEELRPLNISLKVVDLNGSGDWASELSTYALSLPLSQQSLLSVEQSLSADPPIFLTNTGSRVVVWRKIAGAWFIHYDAML